MVDVRADYPGIARYGMSGYSQSWDAALERFLASCVETLEFGGVALMLWSFDASRLSVLGNQVIVSPTIARPARTADPNEERRP